MWPHLQLQAFHFEFVKARNYYLYILFIQYIRNFGFHVCLSHLKYTQSLSPPNEGLVFKAVK